MANLQNLSLILQLSATLQAVVESGAWPNRTQGPNQITANLQGVDLTQWDQPFVHHVLLGAGANATIDLFSFTDLAGNAASLTKAFLYAFQTFPNNPAVPTAPVCSVTVVPAASNGLQGPFNGTGAGSGITIAPFRTMVLTDATNLDPPAGDTIDATHRQLTFTNTGTDSVDLYMIIVGK